MIRVLCMVLMLACSSWASQSFILQPGRQATLTFPGGSPMCANVNDFRPEGHFQVVAIPTGTEWILRQNTSWGLNLDPSMNLGMLLLNTNGGPSVNIAGWTYVRWRVRRNTTSGNYTLEAWNEVTGERKVATGVDPAPGAYNPIGCAFYIGAQSGTAASVNIGAIRIYSTIGTLNAALPPRFLTSGYADYLDLELEDDLLDRSGRGLNATMTSGTAFYQKTTEFAPVLSLSSPPVGRVGTPTTFSGSCISNDDSDTCSYYWSQIGGPAAGDWSNRTSVAASFIPPVFGQYDLQLRISTATQTATQLVTLGAVATDDQGNVVIADSRIAAILGPTIRDGANPWSWFDDRAKKVAQYQIDMQTGANGATPFWSSPWDTNLTGTISVTNQSKIVTGTGTQFQTDFCGGAGNTSPTANFNRIFIKYNSAEYPGTQGLAAYGIQSCDSQTQLTLNNGWGHATGTQSGIRFARADNAVSGWWTTTGTPGNYYDNVLGFYMLYYRSGQTKYRDAARTLARNWWYGPFYDRGKNYDTSALGGNFISAGPARGQSITGLILWSLDTGENIWPGMNFVLNWFRDVGWNYAQTRNWNVQIGDLREQAYLTASYALAARYHPNAGVRQTYRGYLKDYINLFWKPLQLPSGEWRNTVITSAAYFGPSSYVTVTPGSPQITVTGGTWTEATFYNGNFSGPSTNKKAYLWFFNNPTSTGLPGKQNSDVGGDTVFYRISSVLSPTTALLDRPYEGTAGNKGMTVSDQAGFGTQPFMMGLTAGVFGTYVYDALTWHGDTTEAALARQFTIDAVKWLATPVAFKSGANYIYGASTFLNCQADPDSPGCAGDTVVNGEIMRGVAAAYRFTLDEEILRFGDNAYGAVWCKPTGGWGCPAGSNGVYGNYLDDPPSGYMLNRNDPLTNKWFGFFFGYGFGGMWPSVRQGGLAAPDTRTVLVSYSLPAGATSATLDYTTAAGATTGTITGSGGVFVVPTDWAYREGVARIRYTFPSGVVWQGDAVQILKR